MAGRMNQKTLFFSSLLQRAGDDMKKQFFFICGDGLTRSIHVQHNYYDYHYLGDDATLRCGGVWVETISFSLCHHKWKSKIIIIQI